MKINLERNLLGLPMPYNLLAVTLAKLLFCASSFLICKMGIMTIPISELL